MTMKLRALVLAAAAAVLLAGGFGARMHGAGSASAQQATPTATPVTTGNIPVIAINQEFCFLLGAVAPDPAPTIAATSCPGLQGQSNLAQILTIFGDKDTIPDPKDFAGIDLDGNQVHQMDLYSQSSTSGSPGSLYIMAFVPNYGPVHFHTNKGFFVQNSGGDPTSQDWTCDTFAEDPDCVAGGTGGDGVVVARLRANDGTNLTPATTFAPTGPGTVTLTQASTDTATIAFRVVGEPRNISFITLENKLQDGLPLSADGKASSPDCPLPTDAGGFLGGNGTAEKSLVLGVAKDLDGNPITGAIIVWSTDDKDKAVMAAPLTPTLDLGSFGFGAPNMLCGTTNPGTVTVTGTISRDLLPVANVLNVDPNAQPQSGTSDFTVVGVPASVTLAPDPASLPCDGTATSKITATVMDAAGNPSAAGQQVHFDTQTLATADPVNGKTDDKGVATSTISPLSQLASGVPIVVTAGSVSNSVLLSCVAGAAVTPPAGGGGAPAGAPSGVPITGPNTGTGPAAQAQSSWIYLVVLSALGLLTGSALVWTGARAKGR